MKRQSKFDLPPLYQAMNVLMVYLFITIIGSTQSQEDIENLPQLSPGDGFKLYNSYSHKYLSNFAMLRSDEFGLHPIIPCDAPDYEINSSSIGALYILAGSSPNNIYCYYPSGWTISWQAYILKPFSRGANTNRAYLQRHCEVTYIQRYEYAIGLFECFVSWSPSNFAKVFFGIYPPSEYNKAVIPWVTAPIFQFLSDQHFNDPPAFSLTFNVTHRPPTNVTCFVNNGAPLNINDEDLKRVAIKTQHNFNPWFSIVVNVTVIIRHREAGQYHCNVTNERIENDTNLFPAMTAPVYISVTPPPTNVTINRTSSGHMILSWTPSTTVTAINMELVDNNDGTKTHQNANRTGPLLLTSLQPNHNYTVKLIASGSEKFRSLVVMSYITQIGGSLELTTFTNGSALIGKMYTLTCVPDTTVDTVSWLYNGKLITPGNGINLTNSGNSSSITFNQLKYSYVGVYTCASNLTTQKVDGILYRTGIAHRRVSIQIPAPTVSITPATSITLGTISNLLCTVTLTDLIPPSLNVNISITKDGQLVTNGKRITITQVSDTVMRVTFTPLVATDAGDYKCTAVVSSEVSFIYASSPVSTVYTLPSVQDVIPITSIITFPRIPGKLVGESTSLYCSIDVHDNLYQFNVIISIVNNKGNIIATNYSSGDVSAVKKIEPILASNAGEYQCIVNISQSLIGYQLNVIEYGQLNVTIPIPSISVFSGSLTANGSYSTGPLMEGQFFDAVCTAGISHSIDVSVNVTMEWNRNHGTTLTNRKKFIISPVTNKLNKYTITLRINNLTYNEDHQTLYICLINITSSSPFITSSKSSHFITVEMTNARGTSFHNVSSISLISVLVMLTTIGFVITMMGTIHYLNSQRKFIRMNGIAGQWWY